jgi:D-alanine-D-alanine ligase-like ATP-grasp enzyme
MLKNTSTKKKPSIKKPKALGKPRVRLLSTCLKSGSLKRLAEGLSTKLGYKVWRSKNQKPNKIHLLYGDQKGKIEQYAWFKEQGITALDYTTKHSEAVAWAKDGIVVVCRTLTHASEGKGIVIAEEAGQVVVAPVYTQYKKKKKEFRVHIFQDKVVHVLEKRRKTNFEGTTDAKIRNTANGYVFCSDGVVEPVGLRDLALAASKVTKSDFKGVDIGFNEKKNELFVIEVNSAPGIEGSNVDRYVNTIVQGL